MAVIGVDTDHDKLTVTVTSDFDAPVERVWELWADPRRLERWWGPPSYPARFETHDLSPGGEVRYVMTGPDGDRYAGLWRVTDVDPPFVLRFDDVFTDVEWRPVSGRPVTRVDVQLDARDDGTHMVLRAAFTSRRDLEQWLSTGTREGLTRAVAQMDGLIRGGPSIG